jgi:hypothetical protein
VARDLNIQKGTTLLLAPSYACRLLQLCNQAGVAGNEPHGSTAASAKPDRYRHEMYVWTISTSLPWSVMKANRIPKVASSDKEKPRLADRA